MITMCAAVRWLCSTSQGERAMWVLAGRWVVEVDRVGLKDVDAVGCSGVDVLVDLAGIKRYVVVVADGERNDVGSWWL
jgi:hypothetical protein